MDIRIVIFDFVEERGHSYSLVSKSVKSIEDTFDLIPAILVQYALFC